MNQQQQFSTPHDRRRHTLNSIRSSLQTTQIIKKNSLAVQNKLERRKIRKESLRLEQQGKTEMQIAEMLERIEKEEDSIKSMGKFMEKYDLGEKIGEGSNGLVRKCYLKATRELFAVKTITMDDEHIMFLKKNFKYIKALNHPNVIRYHCMYLQKSKSLCHLVMDYDEHPNLMEFSNLSENEIRSIAFQLLNTIAFIHEKHVCHRDIKPENILYDCSNKKIKIIDFGISKKNFIRGAKKQMLTITGTLFYRAPQMFDGGGYDQKVDVWAAGITLYQLLTKGKTPFQSQYLTTTIQNIRNGKIHFDEEIWRNYSKQAKDLVIRVLKKYQDRPTAQQVKKHFWFSQLQKIDKSDIHKSASLIKTNSSLEKCLKTHSNNFLQERLLKTFINTQKISLCAPDQNSPESPQNKAVKKKGLLKSYMEESEDEQQGLVDQEQQQERLKRSDITV